MNASLFDTIDYLGRGSEKQKEVYYILKNHKIMEHLVLYNPILTGTIPIQMDTNESDLDIFCC